MRINQGGIAEVQLGDGVDVALLTAPADGLALTNEQLEVLATLQVFNGTNTDRLRSGGADMPLLGTIRSVDMANPITQKDSVLNDSNKTITVPANTQWRIIALLVNYTPTATAGDRQIEVIIGDTYSYWTDIKAGAVFPANTQVLISFFPGAPLQSAFISNRLVAPLPDLWLPPASIIKVLDSAAIAAAADDMIVNLLVDVRDIS